MSYKTYESYKDSGIEWIGKIPQNWSISRVKNYFAIKSGDSPVKKESGKYEIIGANGCIGVTDDFNITEKHITIGRVGAAGAINITPQKAFVSDNALILDFNKDFIFNYAFYLLKSLNWDSLINKNAQPLITSSQVKNLFIPKIHIDEQLQISKFLDKKTSEIDENIAKNKELISLLEEKKTALINQVVTKGLDPNVPMKDSGIEWIGEIPEHWVIKKLKYCVDLNSSSLSENTDDYYEFDYVDISSVSLEKGIEKYEHMYFKDSPSRARRIVKKDDIIVSTVRTYLKAIAVIPDKKDVIVSTGFAVLTPRNINSSFLAYLTKSNYFVNLVSAHSVGVSYPAINSSVLVNLKIVIPPTEELL